VFIFTIADGGEVWWGEGVAIAPWPPPRDGDLGLAMGRGRRSGARRARLDRTAARPTALRPGKTTYYVQEL